jgi:hypothetical protein
MQDFLVALANAMEADHKLIRALMPVWGRVVDIRHFRCNTAEATKELIVCAMPAIQAAKLDALQESFSMVYQEMKRCK